QQPSQLESRHRTVHVATPKRERRPRWQPRRPPSSAPPGVDGTRPQRYSRSSRLQPLPIHKAIHAACPVSAHDDSGHDAVASAAPPRRCDRQARGRAAPHAALRTPPGARGLGAEARPIMLVLTRKLGENIRIGDAVKITVLEVRSGQVKLGIEAPPEVKVHREEIYARIQQEKKEAAQRPPATGTDPGKK